GVGGNRHENIRRTTARFRQDSGAEGFREQAIHGAYGDAGRQVGARRRFYPFPEIRGQSFFHVMRHGASVVAGFAEAQPVPWKLPMGDSDHWDLRFSGPIVTHSRWYFNKASQRSSDSSMS